MQLAPGKNRHKQSAGFYLFQRIVGVSANGKKIVSPFVSGLIHHHTADYIFSAYRNEDGSHVSYALTFDIDNKRGETSGKWLDEEGRVDWDKIYSFLRNEHPIISQYIMFAARSPGGKGLGFGIAISPIVINGTTSRKLEKLGICLQRAIIRLLRYEGIGADEANLGVCRATPNWKRLRATGTHVQQLYFNRFIRARIKNEDINVISELLTYTNGIPVCQEELKKDKAELVHTDKRTEAGWAKLYLHLFDALSYQDDLTISRLMEITGLSCHTLLNTLKGRIKNPPRWLKHEYINREEGYHLSINFNVEQPCLDRANALQEGKILGSTVLKDLGCPTQVKPGKRNEWVFSAIVWMKWCNISIPEAKCLMRKLVAHIPSHDESFSCQNISAMVDRLYRNKSETQGTRHLSELPPVLTSEYLSNLKKLERPPLGFGVSIQLAFKRKCQERYAVAYRNGSVSAVLKMDGNKYKDQLLAVQSLMTMLPEKPKVLEITGLNYLEGRPLTNKFEQHHQVSMVYSEGEKVEFHPENARSGHRVLESIGHYEQHECKVRCDGHVYYKGAYYWVGTSYVDLKGHILDDGTSVEFWFDGSIPLAQDKLRKNQVSGPCPSFKKAWIDMCKVGSWLRRKAQVVGLAFDQYYLRVLQGGKGLVDTRYLQFIGKGGYPRDQLNAVATHCLRHNNYSFRYFRSCLENAIF